MKKMLQSEKSVEIKQFFKRKTKYI